MRDEVFSARRFDQITLDRLRQRVAFMLSIMLIALADGAKIFFNIE